MIAYLQMIETPADREKFEVIYTEYKGLMHHIAYDILRNRQDAEDAVHNAFVKIAENITKIGDPDCPKSKAYIVTFRLPLSPFDTCLTVKKCVQADLTSYLQILLSML